MDNKRRAAVVCAASAAVIASSAATLTHSTSNATHAILGFVVGLMLTLSIALFIKSKRLN